MMSNVSGGMGGGGMPQPAQMNMPTPDIRANTGGTRQPGQNPGEQVQGTGADVLNNQAGQVPGSAGGLAGELPGGIEGSAAGEKREAMLEGARAVIQYWENDPRDRVSPEVREQYAAPENQLDTAEARLDGMADQVEVGAVETAPGENPPEAQPESEGIVDPDEAAMEEVQQNLSGIQQQEPNTEETAQSPTDADQGDTGEIMDMFA